MRAHKRQRGVVGRARRGQTVAVERETNFNHIREGSSRSTQSFPIYTRGGERKASRDAPMLSPSCAHARAPFSRKQEDESPPGALIPFFFSRSTHTRALSRMGMENARALIYLCIMRRSAPLSPLV